MTKDKKPSKYNMMRERVKEEISIQDIANEFGLTVTNPSQPLSSLVEHDSVIIYNDTNSFYRHATGVGGDVITFMKEMPEINMNYQEAIKYLFKKLDPNIKDFKPRTKAPRPVEVPLSAKERSEQLLSQCDFDTNNKNVMAYLIRERKIDPDLVYEFIKKGYIKQETNNLGFKNVCFLGYDDVGQITAICKRAASSISKFKSECKGNNYSIGWLYDKDASPKHLADGSAELNKNKILVCFESEIEKLSYMTLLKQDGKDLSKFAFLSTGSAVRYNTIIETVKRIGYKTVHIGYNNDIKSVEKGNVNVGQEYAKKATTALREQFGTTVINIIPPNGINDWNDLLKEITIKKEESPTHQVNDKMNLKDRIVSAKATVAAKENKSPSLSKEKIRQKNIN